MTVLTRRTLLIEAESQIAHVSDLIRRKRRLIELRRQGPRPLDEVRRELATLLAVRAAHEAYRDESRASLGLPHARAPEEPEPD